MHPTFLYFIYVDDKKNNIFKIGHTINIIQRNL